MIHSAVTGKWLKLVLLLSQECCPEQGLDWGDLTPSTNKPPISQKWKKSPTTTSEIKKPCKQWDKVPTSTGLKDFFHQQYDGCEAFIEAVLPGDVSPGAVQAALYAQGLRYHSNLGCKLKWIK